MDLISSRYRKPKGRPKRSRQVKSENAKRRWAKKSLDVEQSMVSTDSTNCNEPEKNNSVSKSVDSDYIIMCKKLWSSLLKNIPCHECKENTLQINQTSSFGFSSKIFLSCANCKKEFGSVFTSEREAEDKSFQVNNKVVEAFLAIGRGHSALETFSMVLGTPSMDSKTFNNCMKNVCLKNKHAKLQMLELSRNAVRDAHIIENPELEKSAVLDISVSYDGTWQKRGFTSNLGVGCVIDMLTGIVVDFEILSKYCHECVIAERDLKKNSVEFHIWFDGHKDDCEKNFHGSSGSMELHAAEIMWKRSIKECGFRYTKILCDGDSKTFLHLNEEKVYGPEEIQKEECINHISKRLGTALRNKVKEWKVKKVTLGGKKPGSLKETTITKLQNYYRKAVKDNAPNVTEMKSSIFASLYHCMSTDSKPQHSKCPVGASSWCFFQRAIAQGEKPKSHKKMKTILSELVVEKILPVYQRLASDEMLTRCISAKTQNANESLHSCIWRKCPKEIFISKKRLELGVSTAVSENNLGYVKNLTIKEENVSETDSRFAIAYKKDKKRAAQNKRKSSEIYKKQRNEKKFKKQKNVEQQERHEGITYAAGAF
ncbi:unnamed protein product [Larinioides sclopetarius]|uniref:Mutator-like transposase domain-containing protein n=1 Tax=Larinioides sclopetarius TaxID=280406 RepID=A0AAV2AVP1_9ARAC